MNISVSLTGKKEPNLWTYGYSTARVDIKVDEDLPHTHQQGVVIHELIETYCKFLPHDKVEELTGYIQQGLQQLEEVRE